MTKINKTAREVLEDALDAEKRTREFYEKRAAELEDQLKQLRSAADQAASRQAAIEEVLA